jgi:hypothetical protein
MIRAAEANGLPQTEGQPWHLEVASHSFDEIGNIRNQAVLDEFYVNPTKFKTVYSSSGSSQTIYGTEKGLMYAGSPTGPSPLIKALQDPFTTPLLMSFAKERHTLNSELRRYDGADHLCISVNQPDTAGQPSRRIGTFCFDPATGFLEYTVYEAVPISVTRSHPVTFQGHLLPGDLEVQMSGKVAFAAHLDRIEPLTSIDDSMFVPPPGATQPIVVGGALDGRGAADPSGSSSVGTPPPTLTRPKRVNISGGVAQAMLLKKIDPIYPGDVNQEETVVLDALISKEGHIESLRVISGPAMLVGAALDAVKEWTYRPFLLNGEPVEVGTTIKVVFARVRK